LIDHAKSAHAARGCPTLLNGEEAAICDSESPVDVKQRRCQHECRNKFGHKAHLDLLAVFGKNTGWPASIPSSKTWIKVKNPKAPAATQAVNGQTAPLKRDTKV
jgi:hypothetical protein